MHIHIVHFWLIDDVGAAGRKKFEDGLVGLAAAPQVRNRSIGRPAATDREVVDASYDYAIVLRFEDLAAHDAYQKSREHQRFLDACFDMVRRVQVYDVEEISAD